MIASLMTGIETLIRDSSNPNAITLRQTLNWYCWGTVPDLGENGEKIKYPYLSMSIPDNTEEDTAFSDGDFDNTVDYYTDITVLFAIATYAPQDTTGGSPLQAALLMENIKNLFRMQSPPLLTGRVLCSRIGPDIPTQTGDADGVDDFVMITFETGT